jgi:hypothetical protein
MSTESLESPEPVEEKRSATRVGTGLEVDARCGNRTISSARTRDLSLTGVYVYCDEPFEERLDCQIEIFMEGREGQGVKARGKIARVDRQGMALQFREVGIESFQQLRNLILYSSQNDETTNRIKREYLEHAELRKQQEAA